MRYLLALTALMSIFFSSYSYSNQIPEEDVSKARLTLGPDRWIQLHYFLQTNFNYGKLDSENSYDFQIRRSRIILNGQVAPKVDFFFQTDDLKAGNSSDKSKTDNDTDGANHIFTQDAFARLTVNRGFQIMAGLLTVPLTRTNLSSQATTLCAIEDSNLSVMSNYSNNGRDAGVMLRGLFGTRAFEYRLGVFDGYSRGAKDVKGRNNSDSPRLSARISWNALENEDDESYFYSENYLGKRNVLAFGVGVDFQNKVYPTSSGEFKNYFAWSLDTAVDVNMSSATVLTMQGGIIMGSNNPGEGLPDDETIIVPLYDEYMTIHAQAGMLFFQQVQPVMRYSYRKNTLNGGGTETLSNLAFGVNFFINSHYAAIKTLYSHPLKDSIDKDSKRLDLSFQIYM